MFVKCFVCRKTYPVIHTGAVQFDKDRVVEEFTCPHCLNVGLYQTHKIVVVKLEQPKLIGYRRRDAKV